MDNTESDFEGNLEVIREKITNCLKNEPDMLALFYKVEQNIDKMTVNEIRMLANSMDYY